MSTIMNLLLKFSGLGWLMDKVDGYKVYLLSFITFLTALLGLLNELVPVLDTKDPGAIFNFLTHLGKDPYWLAIMSSGIIGAFRHMFEKQSGSTMTVAADASGAMAQISQGPNQGANVETSTQTVSQVSSPTLTEASSQQAPTPGAAPNP